MLVCGNVRPEYSVEEGEFFDAMDVLRAACIDLEGLLKKPSHRLKMRGLYFSVLRQTCIAASHSQSVPNNPRNSSKSPVPLEPSPSRSPTHISIGRQV